MINVPENVKNIFYTDNSKKRLVLSTNPNWIYDEDIDYQKNMDELNLFNGNAYLNTKWHMDYTSNPFDETESFNFKINRYSNIDSYDATDFVKTFAFKYRQYVNITFDCGIKNTGQSYPQKLKYGVVYCDGAGVEREKYIEFNVIDYLVDGEWDLKGPLSITLQTKSISSIGVSNIKNIKVTSIEGNEDFYGYIVYSKPRISVSDNPDSFPIDYHVDDYSEIDLTEYVPFILLDNEDIEFEKFELTESLCSRNNIEFGLCEAANSSVTLINDTHNLKDEKLYIQTVVKTNDPDNITYSALKRINWYKGTRYNFNPQIGFNTSWNNVTANWFYSNWFGDVIISDYDEYFSQNTYIFVRFKLKFNYFNVVSESQVHYVQIGYGFQRGGASGWNQYYNINHSNCILSNLLNDYQEFKFGVLYNTEQGKIDLLSDIRFRIYDENKQQITATINAKFFVKELQVCSYNNVNGKEACLDFNIDDCYVYNDTLDQYLIDHREYGIPLGVFNVNEINNEISYDLVRKNLTMYDNMILLEQNAANWYTHYMYGISTNEASPYGFEFARQIYSSYFNYMKSIGVMSVPDVDEMIEVLEKTHDELLNSMSTKTYTFFATTSADYTVVYNSSKLYYSKTVVNDVDPQKLYLIKFYNYELRSTITMPYYYQYHDAQGRGMRTCNILIEEELSDGTYNRFAVDSDDFFALSLNVVRFNIYVPVYGIVNIESDPRQYDIIDHFELYSIDKGFDLENASSRLLYYDYNYTDGFETTDYWVDGQKYTSYHNTYPYHIIFECDSNITGRDVVHSLLELTGCFFRMNRKTGEPEFIYCTKSGLYPSNTLYPADDLYPRRGTNQVASMGTYISTEYADYTVTRFGKIQILKNQTSNDAESNVQWQYAGDEDVGLNTYIIDDNIFYCNKDMTYDTEHMQELNKILEKMYYRISNMDYVPNTTEALGMPWIECGDRVGLLTAIGGFETFIYRRTLKGIQGLFDVYESRGDEYNNAISNYGY